MSLLSAVASCWALLLGLGLIMLGNGLQGTLLGVRASLEGFSPATTGYVMTAYFAGFLAGSLVVPRLLRNVGHIRVFTALASLASAAVLAHAVLLDPRWWGLFRAVTGFSFAGLYVVAESWLNDAATNRTRGQLLSVYMLIVTGGMALGQLLLNVADPAGYDLFVLISVLVSIAVVPIALTASPAPAFETPAPVSLRSLYATSPLGVTGMLAVGLAHGALFTMGAVYASAQGLDTREISIFMASVLFGAMALQWPIGWLSDRLDRRHVLAGAGAAAGLAATATAVAGPESRALLYALAALLGGTAVPLYSLCIAHTNDFLERSQIVAASATLVLVASIGLTLGPAISGALMQRLGPNGLFWYLAAVLGGLGAFAVYRMTRRPSGVHQRHYPPVSMRGSPLGAALASRSVRDHRDRDLARWSTR